MRLPAIIPDGRESNQGEIQTLRQPALVEFEFPVGAFPFYPASAQFR
jgi:hypothetical protein